MTAVAEPTNDTSQIPAPEGSITITVKILRFNPEVDSDIPAMLDLTYLPQ